MLCPTNTMTPRVMDDEWFRDTFDRLPVGVAHVRLDNCRCLRTNRALGRMLGASKALLRRRTLLDLICEHDRATVSEHVSRLRKRRRTSSTVHARLILPDGELTRSRIDMAVIPGLTGDSCLLTIQEESKRSAHGTSADHAQAERLERRDYLTGLPNREFLQAQLDRTLHSAPDEPVTLLLLDLDRFKEINDTFGHHVGDGLLAELGPRLHDSLGGSVTVARLGGDEFGVIIPGATETAARDVATLLLAIVDAPMDRDGYTLRVGGSIGAAFYPEHGADANELLRRADVAMYSAKKDRRGFAVYEPARDHYTPERLQLMSELRSAIEHEELTLHFQPKASLSTGRIQGAEALVRWLHPERGSVPPDAFIPVAEHGGLMGPLSLWVLNAALKQIRQWRTVGRDMTVAVNLSARNLYDVDLVPTVEDLLATWGVDPQALRVELTETSMMDDPEAALRTLVDLHSMGVRIAIDDFGTGYSSLSYLSRLPVDELKIDRRFVTDMVERKHDAFIVRLTIELGHNLGLEVVAEGVENRRTWDLLGVLGCDTAQGFYRPASRRLAE